MAKTGGETPRILDVGQCNHDHGKITGFLTERFGATVDRAHGLEDARELMSKTRYDLVLVNRLLDVDQESGLEVIRSLREVADPGIAAVPFMLVSNYPEAQQAAVEVGAELGFGKAEFDDPTTFDRLSALLN